MTTTAVSCPVAVQGINFTFMLDRRAAWALIAHAYLGQYDSRERLRSGNTHRPLATEHVDRILEANGCPGITLDETAGTICSVIARAMLACPNSDTLFVAYQLALADGVNFDDRESLMRWSSHVSSVETMKLDEVATAELDLLFNTPQFATADDLGNW